MLGLPLRRPTLSLLRSAASLQSILQPSTFTPIDHEQLRTVFQHDLLGTLNHESVVLKRSAQASRPLFGMEGIWPSFRPEGLPVSGRQSPDTQEILTPRCSRALPRGDNRDKTNLQLSSKSNTASAAERRRRSAAISTM
jgi:hypothetical protein